MPRASSNYSNNIQTTSNNIINHRKKGKKEQFHTVKGEIKGRGEAHCTKLTWTQGECRGEDDGGRDGRWRTGSDIHVRLLPTQRDRMLPTRGGGCGPSHDAKLTAEQSLTKKKSRGMVESMNQSLRSRMR